MTEYVLFCLLGLPLICGTLAWLVKSSGVRSALIVFSALAVAVCGVALVVLTRQAPNGVWTYAVAPNLDWLGSALEFIMVAIILGVAIKIRNVWIILMGVLQLLMVTACYFIPPAEHHELILFQIDNLARILLIVTCVVGSTILIFAIGYMKQHEHHAPPGAGSLGRFFFFFIGFLGFMSGLVVSNNLSFFSFFWEATTLCSYALIGQDGGEARRVNATRALLINSFGGTLLIFAVFLIKTRIGGESFEEIFQKNTLTLVPAILLCVAAFTKSALFPFQSWLLGAMVAPTPVSAMLHSATMVKAGVYLVMRITPGFYDHPKALMMVAFSGALTFVGGALLACTQSNAKKVLAYSTISNLGLVVACAGLNTPLAYAAGLAIITFHAISKGLLFLCVGNIEQKIGSRDIEAMDGMLFKMPFTTQMALLGMMSMLLPPFGMLLSKWLAIEATIRSPLLFIFMVIGSALTVFFWAKWIGRMQNTGYHQHMPKEKISASVRLSLSIMGLLVVGTGLCTMWIFVNVFSPMARGVFGNFLNVNWETFNEVEQFYYPSLIIFAFMALALVVYYFAFWRRFRPENVRLPFLCGENVDIDKLNPEDDVRSYDFHSIYDRVEHTVISSMYFRGIVNEKWTTRCLNWAAWLIIIALIGLSIANR